MNLLVPGSSRLQTNLSLLREMGGMRLARCERSQVRSLVGSGSGSE